MSKRKSRHTGVIVPIETDESQIAVSAEVLPFGDPKKAAIWKDVTERVYAGELSATAALKELAKLYAA